MKNIIFLFVTALASVSFAEIQQEVDSFGGNEALYKKAEALNPEIKTQVVQDRFINRTYRFEIAPEFASVFGGDAYNKSSDMGLNMYFHLSPNWSLGAKYNYYTNKLTPEGEAMISRANQAAVSNPGNPSFLYPQVIYPKTATMGLVNWYPIVGKLSFGSWGVAHFDTYFLAGYGTMELSNGTTPLTALGAGLGFWINSHFTTRLEYRAEAYTAKYYDEERKMSTGTAALQVGWML